MNVQRRKRAVFFRVLLCRFLLVCESEERELGLAKIVRLDKPNPGQKISIASRKNLPFLESKKMIIPRFELGAFSV